MYPSVAATTIAVIAIALSVPTTLQLFIYWRNPDHLFGNGKPFGKQLYGYDAETLAVTDFLTKDAQPGDVVLCGNELLAPILALTRCRVPFGYFAYAAVPRTDYMRRESVVKQFWKDWQLGKVPQDLLREMEVRYILVRKTSDGLPTTILSIVSNVFENSEFAVFKVDWQNITETDARHL